MGNEYIGEKVICSRVPLTFAPQHQENQPGYEYCMEPRPVSYRPDNASGKLSGKIALLTGGDSGIGRAVAYAFAGEGADIAFTFYDELKDAKETKQFIENMGRRCLMLPVNLTSREAAEDVRKAVMDTFGHIDILVNNQAVQFVQDGLCKITPSQLELVFQTNVFSYFYMTQALLPFMSAGASIINTASVTAHQGDKDLIDYSATKGAIIAFTRSLALSLADKLIRVNAVSPGPVWTPLIPSSYSAEAIETFGTKTSKVPMMRAGQPAEIAPCYVFLASYDASFITGQVLHPNGGIII